MRISSAPSTGRGSDTDQGEAARLTGSSAEEDEGPSGMEGDGSLTEGRSEPTTTSEDYSSSSEDSLVVGGDPRKATTTSESAPTTTTTTTSTLPAAPIPTVHARSHFGEHVSFRAGTAPPASVPPGALSAESVDLLKQISVGQTALLNSLHVHTTHFNQIVAFLGGISSDMSALQRSNQAMASSLMAAVSLLQRYLPPPSSATSTDPTALPDPSTLKLTHTHTNRHIQNTNTQTQV